MSYNSSFEESANLEDLGFRPRQATHESIFGKFRTLSSLSWTEIAFLLMTVISLLASCGLCIFKLTQVDPVNDPDNDFIFGIILIVNALFCVYYIFHGVFSERPYEIAVYTGAAIIVTIYLIINFVQTQGWDDPIKIARLVAAALLAPITVCMGVILTREYLDSGNLIFRTVGAREELQFACKRVFITEALIKFDLQIESTMLILIIHGSSLGLKQSITLGIGFPFSIIWAMFGYLVIRFEHKIGCILFIIAGLLEPAYVIFLVYQAAVSMRLAPTFLPPIINTTSAYDNIGGILYETTAFPTTLAPSASIPIMSSVTFACGAAALVLRFGLLISTFVCTKSFGIGLKEKIAPKFCSGRKRGDTMDTLAGSAS